VRTILVTGSDTGVGKTHVVASLARKYCGEGKTVQIVKVVETGAGELPNGEGDADRALRLSGIKADAFTLASFPLPLSPPAAAARAGRPLSMEALLERLGALPPCDLRICEGAGGIATPVDAGGNDWADFAAAIGAQAVVIVVPDRLGAINQARLAQGRAAEAELNAGIWLNAWGTVDSSVAESNREGLRAARVPLWDDAMGSGPEFSTAVENSGPDPIWLARCRSELAEREEKHLLRSLRVADPKAGELNLANNDYLDLARDPSVVAAASGALERHGTSASASPLITGWREPHARLVEALSAWQGFPCGLLWSSGYAANSAVLGTLPQKGDLVLADRLVHHSIVAGMLQSGARVQRYRHLDLEELERRLVEAKGAGLGSCSTGQDPRPAPLRTVFVVTESLFSMDGDFPDLARMGELKRRHGFCWIVDEAHALGWYGPDGSGLARAAGVEGDVDVLVGTLGKALASGGAYTLFRDEAVRDFLVNRAGEFIYSTALPPANAAAAHAALERIRVLAPGQGEWHRSSRAFRSALRKSGWKAPEGESPIVPIRLDNEPDALALAAALRSAGIHAGAVRPPTVPKGTSRLRFSLKRSFGEAEAGRVLGAMAAWRKGGRS